MSENIGKIISLQREVAEIYFKEKLPSVHNILETRDKRGIFEVTEIKTDNVVRVIALTSLEGIERGAEVIDTGNPILIPVGMNILGRMFDVFGNPIDNKPFKSSRKQPIFKKKEGEIISLGKPSLLETGIKVIDLLTPFKKGNELYLTLRELETLKNTTLFFGEMDKPAGVRFRVALSAITAAEYLRDSTGKDILFFMDNIFRYAMAGMEVGAILGKVPSELGYQPTLEGDIAELEERINSTEKGSITSVQAVYVPADDITDPAVITIFSHLDSSLVLSRQIAEKGFYPAVDLLRSRSVNIDKEIVGERHFRIAKDVKEIFQRYKELSRIIDILGVEELSRADKIIAQRAERLRRFLTQPLFVTERYSDKKGVYVPLKKTLDGCERIINGEFDNVDPMKLYMIGGIDEIKK